MDITVVQTKEGSSLQFLPVIRLEREEGGVKARAGCCATESTCCKLFHPAGEATPAPPQLSRQSGTGATGGNLWKDHSPQPQAWKDYVFIL